jgi:hypothetical protein
MAKPKAAKTAQAVSNEASEREQFEEQRFLNAFRQIKGMKSEIGESMAEIKDIYKGLKPLGFTKGDITWAFELEEKDAGDIIATMQRRIRIAKMLGHGLARQIDLFGEDRTPLEDRAYDEGLAAGKLRKDMASPYGLDSEAGQAFQRGINDGTAFVNKDLSAQFDASDELIKAGDDGEDDPFQDAAE